MPSADETKMINAVTIVTRCKISQIRTIDTHKPLWNSGLEHSSRVLSRTIYPVSQPGLVPRCDETGSTEQALEPWVV